MNILQESVAAIRLRHERPDLPRLGWAVMHIGLVAVLAWWSFLLFLPVHTFDTGPGYNAFVEICPDEDYWATGFGLAALAGAWGLVTQRQWMRVTSGLVMCANHGMIAILCARGNPAGTGSGVYLIIAAMALALAWREVQRAG